MTGGTRRDGVAASRGRRVGSGSVATLAALAALAVGLVSALVPVGAAAAETGAGGTSSAEPVAGGTSAAKLGAISARGDLGARSEAVYPPQELPLTFDHAQHAAARIPCERCHATAAGSLTAKDNLMPPESACLPCHAIERGVPDKRVAPGKPAARCDACHPGFSGVTPPGAAVPVEPPRLLVPTAALKFNHKIHAERGLGCALCHAAVEERALATTADLPGMALCLGCHDGKQASARCGACHPTLSDGRLVTTFPSGKLVPSGSLAGFDAHTDAFRVDHRVAGKHERACAVCHKQTECTDCHAAGVVRPADIHPADYATMHAVDGRRNVPNCSSCHRNQSFCLACHQRLGVGADPEGGQPGRQPSNPFGTGTAVKAFHPPGWVRDATGAVLTTPSPASHGFQAIRNLRACVSCHREESCLACHSADLSRSIGINPHGVGFATSPSCRALSSRNQRACLKCHTPGAPELGCR